MSRMRRLRLSRSPRKRSGEGVTPEELAVLIGAEATAPADKAGQQSGKPVHQGNLPDRE
ncbi:MAG: hypothetical protein ACOY4H_10115 [Thermodesulfobacteriota bacterium]